MSDHWTCKDCRWWEDLGEDTAAGICRRRPPMAMAFQHPDPDSFDDLETGFWPTTGSSSWCGEFKEQPDA